MLLRRTWPPDVGKAFWIKVKQAYQQKMMTQGLPKWQREEQQLQLYNSKAPRSWEAAFQRARSPGGEARSGHALSSRLQ